MPQVRMIGQIGATPEEATQLLAVVVQLRKTLEDRIGSTPEPSRSFMVWCRNALGNYALAHDARHPDLVMGSVISCILSLERTIRSTASEPTCQKIHAAAAQMLIKALPQDAIPDLNEARARDAVRMARVMEGMLACVRCHRMRELRQMTESPNGPICGRCWGTDTLEEV